MKPINSIQLKHLRHRLDQATTARINRLAAPLGERPKNSLTDTQKVDLIYEGKVKLKPRNKIDPNYTDLADAYEFPIEKEMAKDAEIWSNKYEKIVSRVNKDKEKLLDKMILGDAEAALKMFTDFESGE